MKRLLVSLAMSISTAALAADGGFLFVTFKGEQSPMTEQVYFALSKDGRNWEALNNSEPVLVSTLGEKGVRDPYLLRSHDGTKFYLLATDLSIHLNHDWRRASQGGSKSIVVWESDDLVHWSEPRLVPVAAEDAGCTWAPEAVYDEDAGDYLVFWASTNKSDNFAKHRIWAVRTKDFKSFGKPFVYIDKPNSVIDTTIVRDGGRYFRFTKDEKHSAITMEESGKVMGPWREVPGFSLAQMRGYEGPECYLVEPASVGRPPTWCLILDYFSKGKGYQPFVAQDLAGGQFKPGDGFSFPFHFRHGSILPLTADEYSRLKAAYSQAAPVDPESTAAPLAWTNPIVPQRADPHVFLHTDGYYYLAATVPEYDRVELRRARTLAGLATADAKAVWTKHAHGPMGAHIWAPEIHYLLGKWYIYFAAGSAESKWDIRMYVLENPSPNPLEGTWTEKGQIRMNWESFTLDATTFLAGGKRYLAWAQSEPEGDGTNIYIARMDTPWSIMGKQVAISKPELPWERVGHHVNEGPAVLVGNGRVFLTYSASATDANYCLGMLAAREDADLLDPASWTKSPEPVFKSDPSASQFGPGHNSFTTTPDGKTDILVYHDRNYERIQGDPLGNPDRATRAQVVRWRPDGTPDFGSPIADGPIR